MLTGVTRQSLIRTTAAALALSALWFAAGVAGDLSPRERAGNSGLRVVLRLPPPLVSEPASPPQASDQPLPS